MPSAQDGTQPVVRGSVARHHQWDVGEGTGQGLCVRNDVLGVSSIGPATKQYEVGSETL